MEARNSLERSYKQHGVRSTPVQPTPPARVGTAPQSSKRSHLPSLHGHRLHHHGQHAKDTIQSAIQLHPPSSFGDLLKTSTRNGHHSPAQSLDESRRESIAARTDATSELDLPQPQPIRPEDVERERKLAKVREDELRSSLQSLSEHSLKTTRRLDDTYYNILEKVSLLRSTIGNLQDLSALTKQLHEGFQVDADGLAEDIAGQVDAFNDFKPQQHQVEKLEARIKAGREKANALNARLENARKRVEARAKIETEEEARSTRRLRVLWSIVGTLAVLIAALLLFQRYRPSHAVDHVKNHSVNHSNNLTEASIPPFAKRILNSSSATRPSSTTLPAVSPSPSSEDEDPRLRILDEL